ncbi:MAG: 2OG-Fe(II) oxygenase [Gammaproteobacteria bacterium]|nr:2OG-Fe(II) oxygenase [Gammaproteobacteria bacterium]
MTKENLESVLAEAEQLDAQGNHDEAINVLARATMDGNQLAKTKLGKRLLVGDRSPYLPKEGAEFILEAAQADIAEAVSLVAVFQATGIYQQKDWPQALKTLTRAATLGSSSAREQLILLSNPPESANYSALIDNDDTQHWENLSGSINLESWLSANEGQALNEDPLVKIFPGMLPPPVCHWLIRLSKKRLKPALVYDAENQRNYQSETRTNSIAEFNLVENELLHFLIQQKMSAACGIPMVQMEGTAILNYQPGEEISAHYDFVNPELSNYEQEIRDKGQRIITFLIYLNEEYEGGETLFTTLDISYKGKTGDGIYFVNALSDGSSDVRTQHSGRPTTSGEKWIISQFIRNLEVKYVL